MGRPQGSRNRKFAVPEKMEQEALAQTDLTEVNQEIEEKFKNFSPARDREKESKILTAQEESRASNESLPFYLRNLPEGSDKSKTLIAAAQAALILGTPPAQVAAQFGLPPARIAEWQNTLITTGAVGRRDRLSDMLMAFIEQEMKSLMAVSMVTSDEDWIMRQSAGELAHYVAVKTDRLLMLLQALGRTESSRQQYTQQLQVITADA